MRALFILICLCPLTSFAQLQQNQQDPALYPYKKPMPPAMMIEQGNAGIPTSGTEQARQLPNTRNRTGYGDNSGPTIIQQGKKRGSPTYIIGPNGTRVCTDAGGRTVVCW